MHVCMYILYLSMYNIMYVCNNLFKPFHGKFGMHVYNCVRLNVPFNFYF